MTLSNSAFSAEELRSVILNIFSHFCEQINGVTAVAMGGLVMGCSKM